MGPSGTIELVLAVLAATAALRLLRAAPVPFLVAVCLLGAAVDTGLVSAPRPAVLERAERELGAWQQETAAGISCQVASREAGSVSDDDAIALLERHCGVR